MKNIGIVMLGEENSWDKLLGEFTYAILKAKYTNEINVKCFADYIKENHGQELKGIPIVSIEQCWVMLAEGKIDGIIAAVRHNYIKMVCEDTYRALLTDVEMYVLKEYVCMEENAGMLSFDDIFVKMDIHKPVLEYYEVHVCDHCNLKCKGCGHLSNICDEKYANLEKYVEDIERLKVLYAGCQSIKLLGGEPLLNEELYKFIEETRRVFPEADIYVGTNGILVPKAEKKLFEVMKKCSVWFMVSGYKPTLSMYGQIEDICTQNGVRVVCNGVINEFSRKVRDEKVSNPYKAHRYCRRNNEWCFTLREGKISPCITFYVEMMNEKFNAGIDISEDDCFDIYKEENGWNLDRKLYNPIPLCRYCGEEKMFSWTSIKPEAARLEDYIISKEEEI